MASQLFYRGQEEIVMEATAVLSGAEEREVQRCRLAQLLFLNSSQFTFLSANKATRFYAVQVHCLYTSRARLSKPLSLTCSSLACS